MIKGKNIICISNTSWFGNYAKSTVQLLERLAHENNVLFVEYPYSIKDIFSTLMGKQNAPISRMLGFKKRLKIIETNVGSNVYNLVIPPVIPLFFLKSDKLFNFLFKANTFIYKQQLKKTISRLKFDQPIVITAFNPFYGLTLLNKLNEKASIYYCYDGVESGFFGNRIFEFEHQFSQKVDAIITTSDHLMNDKKKINSNSYVVKNGVDFPTFNQFSKSKLHNNPRKKVGYIGSLDSRFDIRTVENAVQKLANFDFEFTGDLRNEEIKSRLEKYPNVSFFKPIHQNEVPKLLSSYDVGIIPYIVNEVNKNIYPLKINEYLAVGVPLVMTPFAELPEFEGFVSISSSEADFAQKLEEVTKTDDQKKIETRISFARKNSWDSRTDEFSDILEKFI